MLDRDILLTDLTSDQTRELQNALKALGYYTYPVDGLIGKNTHYAWAEWKADNYLNRHTEIGPLSFDLIQKQANKISKEIDWTGFTSKISEFFTTGEVAQGINSKGELIQYKDRLPVNASHQNNAIRLAKELDKIREMWGSALLITSWYRPPAINSNAGGARNSQHLTGLAADIRPAQGDLLAFQFWLDKRWDKALGYGAKKGFVHVDLRPGGIRWNY